jgi:hypothetical protein
MSANYDEVVFRIKQEVVYLEKDIAAKKESGEPAYLAVLHFPGYGGQKKENSFSEDLYKEQRKLCNAIEAGFKKGTVHARLFDLDLVSLLFSDCSEENAFSYLNEVNAEGAEKAYIGEITYKYIAPSLYNAIYAAFDNAEKEGTVHVSTNLSFQQNYLVEVVSRDRNEDKEDLLIEAVDQVIQKYHAVVR